jgi:serine/threonine-protein kinase
LARAEGPAGFDKLVALKVIHAHLARDERFVEMFLDEARIAARIQHANVCSVFDFGEVDGTYFMAMEHLAGETLADLTRAAWTGTPPPGERERALFTRIIADACEGLHAAHELTRDDGSPLSVVHRDVSPQNIFVTYDGGVRVMDFGVAHAGERIHKTATGTVKGKIAYMAPEQLKGEPLDRRADVWSLGTVCWELLTGRRLFRRKREADTMLALLTTPIPRASSVNPDIGPELDRVVMRALERDREKRYATARDFGRELTSWAASLGRPVDAAALAELMDQHFAEERGRAAEVMRIARQMGSGGVPRIAKLKARDPSKSVALATQTEPSLKVRLLRARWVVAAAIAVLFGIAFGLAFALSPDDDAPPEQGAPIPTASAPAVPVVETPPSGPAAEAETEPPVLATDEDTPEPRTVREPAPERRQKRAVRAPPSAPAEPGTVTVITPGGWADVYLGTRRLGRSPGRFELPAGNHTLRLVPFGDRGARTARVPVPSGGNARAVVRLE